MLLVACGGADDANRLAARCARHAPEPRVQHLASLLTDARIAVSATRVEVIAHVPVGIGIDARPKFRVLRYACTRRGKQLEFDSYTVSSSADADR